jgi:lipopolysaccharide heptosyltransferase II|tara:strand:+ start:5026 stop:6027 length:1002 start_codon:yes stop_codon:yes gene_type:complete
MKILVIRFSSIGDIVLTTPVLRCLKNQLEDVEIHYLTKTKFKSLVENNPNISKVITIENSIEEVLPELKRENYDHVIDLHNNIRTLSLKRKLGRPNASFKKLNVQKWLLVNLKMNKMPDVHIVDRYIETVQDLGVKNDNLPCEFYISSENEVDVKAQFDLEQNQFVGAAIGAQFATKTLPTEQLIKILSKINEPIVLLGGPEDEQKAKDIVIGLPRKEIQNLCGKLNLQQSASVVKQCKVLLTHDTGLMHIASCFEVPVVSVWGNTVPELGMFPYYPQKPDLYSIHEVKNLSCRPCSKIGFQTCPKKHFKCMMDQDLGRIIESMRVMAERGSV